MEEFNQISIEEQPSDDDSSDGLLSEDDSVEEQSSDDSFFDDDWKDYVYLKDKWCKLHRVIYFSSIFINLIYRELYAIVNRIRIHACQTAKMRFCLSLNTILS